MEKLRVFEAFSGYGSQSMALRNIGIDYEVVAISEIDKNAITAYEAIHGEVKNLGDIGQISMEDIPDHDLFTYSFPCQDISCAGKLQGISKSQTRSGLLYECERIIEAKRPPYLLLENVKNLVSQTFKPQFDEWLTYLDSLGYTNYWQVLNAKDYGVPQHRERVFVISIWGEHQPYQFPQPIPLNQTLKDVLSTSVEDTYYVSNERIQRMLNWKAQQRPLTKVLGLDSICPTLTARGAGEYHSGMILLDEQRHHTTNIEPFLLKSQITNTPSPFRLRTLTPRETFRLMGLKETDIDSIQATGLSNSKQYKLAGNSIVVEVLEQLFKQLFNLPSCGTK